MREIIYFYYYHTERIVGGKNIHYYDIILGVKFSGHYKKKATQQLYNIVKDW